MRLPFGLNVLSRTRPINRDAGLASTSTMARTPVYFFSHGGPTIMEQHTHPAYGKLQEMGREITQQVKPRAIVVFSAHWQAEPNVIEVNTAESIGLIYDFYGFPAHYYEMHYPHKGCPELAEKLLGVFGEAGIKAEGVRRGLDHGVWAGFMCAFNPETNPLKVPIVQVSLFDSEDPDQHYRLGQAVSRLREEGIVVIGTGMSVHNLRDFRRAMYLGEGEALPYAHSFDEALKEAAETLPDTRQKAMADLLKRPDARRAHPTFDHLLPVHVAAGAAGNDSGKQLWTLAEGSMAWGQYRFGDIAA
jgi:4,5-DOPA dioxygenase extradiol